MELSTQYSPKEIEQKWYKYWLENNLFHSEPNEKEPYTVVIPPPNVTGVLHMGHMLNNTIQDVLVRRARMQGKNACWVPGTDHASIATEAKVVNKLAQEGIKKTDLSREEFLAHAWEWTHKHGGIILEQLKKLGCSCDWDRTAFTMDEVRSESVLKVFVDLYDKGLIYRGVRMVNWDPKALTALSDEEVNYKEQNGKLYYLKYKIVENETAKIQDAILKLQELGRMPDESEENLSSDTMDYLAKLLKEIEKPVNYNEAEILVKLFPESSLYGIEWTLLHLFESVTKEFTDEQYIQLIEKCPSQEWRERLKTRFNNYKKNDPAAPQSSPEIGGNEGKDEITENDILAEFQSQLSGFSEEKRQKINAVLRQVIENAAK